MHFTPSPGQPKRKSVPLTELLDRYTLSRDAGKTTMAQYRVAQSLLQQYANEQHPGRNWSTMPLQTDEVFSVESFELWVAWLKVSPIRRRLSKMIRSKATVKGRMLEAYILWRFAWMKGFCTQKPPRRKKLPQIKVPKETPVAWSIEEMRVILERSKLAPCLQWWGPMHWFTSLSAYFITSERLTALASCRLSDIDGDHLRIRATTTKDGKSSTHRFPTWLIEEMLRLPRAGDWIGDKADLIWQFPYLLNTMREHYKRDILLPAGLPADSDHLFHCIRRTGITALVNELGIDAAQRQARHSHPGLTIERYVDPTKLQALNGSDVLARNLQPPTNP